MGWDCNKIPEEPVELTEREEYLLEGLHELNLMAFVEKLACAWNRIKWMLFLR